MPQIKPFNGIRYNPDRISAMADVVSPPYDVISVTEQAELHKRSRYNVIRLELGEKHPGDDPHNNPHTRAGRHLHEWLNDGTLLQEKIPAVYLTATEFTMGGAAHTRWGLMASVGLEPFQQGGILPHEHTYSKVKSERLSLMHACPANLSPIFAFFSDESGTMPQLIAHAATIPPAVDFQDDNRHRHRMWVVSSTALHRLIATDLAEQTIFIADGHHRYETALAYRDALAQSGADLPPGHPANFILMYLSSVQDPGLMILPAHRLLPRVAPAMRRSFLERARHFFKVHPLATGAGKSLSPEALLARLGQTEPGAGLAVALRDAETPLLLELLPGKRASLYPATTPEIMEDIDVTLLTDFIFPEILGLSGDQLDDVNCVHYNHDAKAALGGVASGEYDMAFIIKPTPISAVQRIAAAGHVMPRKTTYFAPKVITGLVMHALDKITG